MTALFWIIEYLSTFTEVFLGTVFSGTFIENTNSKPNYKRKIVVSIIAAIVMITINKIELFSVATLAIGLVILYISQIFV